MFSMICIIPIQCLSTPILKTISLKIPIACTLETLKKVLPCATTDAALDASRAQAVRRAAAYNGGRLLSYTAAGAVFGADLATERCGRACEGRGAAEVVARGGVW